MRIRDVRVTYKGVKNKDFPMRIGIFSWAEGVWYEKNVFVLFVKHFGKSLYAYYRTLVKFPRTIQQRKNKISKIEILGWGFYLEIS